MSLALFSLSVLAGLTTPLQFYMYSPRTEDSSTHELVEFHEHLSSTQLKPILVVEQ